MSKKPNARSGRVAYDDKGFDPYSTAVATEPPAPQEPAKPKPPKTRRTLDDMRALSEEIKKNRQK